MLVWKDSEEDFEGPGEGGGDEGEVVGSEYVGRQCVYSFSLEFPFARKSPCCLPDRLLDMLYSCS